MDFSRVALERAERRARESGLELECELADVRELRPAARAFDLVLIVYIHPEPLEREALFAAAAEAVAPGGHLLALGLDRDCPQIGPRGPDPERRYTPDRLSSAFPGIELLRCERVSREVETDDGTARDSRHAGVG